jgi:YebC/PmpR family DNA-binding regulatory protein
MSGHSKWATIKRKKALIDSKRSAAFAKYIKAIEVAARNGGVDPSGNPTLYDAIAKAKKNSVPSENIERALKRASGIESGEVQWQTIMYEGYGPGGVALLIECLSDNRNRVASDVRVAVTRNGGRMADPGSVAYLFERKGVVVLNKFQREREVNEGEVLEIVLDLGADEINDLGETFEIVSDPSNLVSIRSELEKFNIEYESAESSFLPSVSIPVTGEAARELLRLIDAIEDLDDVQNVYGNFDLSEEELASLAQ